MTRLDARSLRRCIAAGAALMALATLPLLAETAVLEQLSSAGKKALAAERFDEAQEIFQKGVLVARVEGEADWVIRMSFYLGLGYQAHAEAEGNKPALLERAARLYHVVLESKPNSGSTMVNLAQVYGKLEMGERANALFRRAIDLGDENRALYESKYAEYLAESGDPKGAAAFYQRAAESEPQSSRAHKALLEAYLDPGIGEEPLLEYLWQQVDDGEVLRAVDGALRALEGGWPERRRIELLTIVVAGLARQFEDPKSFQGSATWERLEPLADDSVIGTGVRELLQLYAAPGNYRPDAFAWWSRWGRQDDRQKSPKRGVWPQEAFRELMRRVGTWYEQRGDWKVAESCYQTAAVLTDGEIDPRSVRSLVDLYIRQGQPEKVQTLADTYRFELFEGKGQAYRHSQVEKIYEYHRTLGEIYGYLARQTGDWGDSGTVASAVFQLERAKTFGDKLERESSDKVYVDPGLVNLLAVAYDGAGREDDKAKLVLGAAETYQARGDLKARDRVIRQVEVESLDAGDRERYQVLQRETVAPVTRHDETERTEAVETEADVSEETQRQHQLEDQRRLNDPSQQTGNIQHIDVRQQQPATAESPKHGVTSALVAQQAQAAIARQETGLESARQHRSLLDLGTFRIGRTHPTTLTAVNRSCRGRRRFDIAIEGAPWLRVTGKSSVIVGRGQSRTTSALIDVRDAAAGEHTGRVVIHCVNCPPSCKQDLEVIDVRLTALD